VHDTITYAVTKTADDISQEPNKAMT